MSSTYFFGVMINALVLGVCVFAWWKGGRAERWGATINLLSSVCSVLTNMYLRGGARESTLLFADGFLAFGLLILGVRYASLWIGGAMLLQAVQFMLHTYYFVMEVRHNTLFAVVNNFVSLGVVFCIAVGAVVSWRKREAERLALA